MNRGQGYVLKEVMTSEQLQPSIDAINELVDDLANKLYSQGKISSLYESEGFETRLIYIEQEFPNASVWLHKCIGVVYTCAPAMRATFYFLQAEVLVRP